MDAADQAVLGQPRLVLGRAVGAVGPDVAGGVGPLDQSLAQARAVVPGGIGGDLAADDPVYSVDRDVGLVAEDGDRDVDLPVSFHARLGLGVLDGPAPVHVLLARLRGGLSGILCGRRCSYTTAKRSPSMMANCAFASNHSRGGRFQSSLARSERGIAAWSLASSFGK